MICLLGEPFIITIGSGMIGLLLNQNLSANILSRLVIMIMVIVIFFDKEYRMNNIPHISKWFFLITIVLIPILTGLQYAKAFINNKALMIIFISYMSVLVIGIVSYTFRNAIKLYPAKRKIILMLLMSIYVVILIIFVLTLSDIAQI